MKSQRFICRCQANCATGTKWTSSRQKETGPSQGRRIAIWGGCISLISQRALPSIRQLILCWHPLMNCLPNLRRGARLLRSLVSGTGVEVGDVRGVWLSSYCKQNGMDALIASAGNLPNTKIDPRKAQNLDRGLRPHGRRSLSLGRDKRQRDRLFGIGAFVTQMGWTGNALLTPICNTVPQNASNRPSK